MKVFRTEMMDESNYGIYMCGGYNYKVDYYDVEAETKEEAITIAKNDNPNYHINTFVKEVEKKEFTINEKDKLIEHIAELEKTLAAYKNYLKEFDIRG